MDSGAIKERIEQIGEDVATIKKLLQGNGDPSKGLVVRVDRLEQNEKRRGKVATTALCGSITAVIGMILKFFIHF